jgi:hypothetical protein
MRILGAPIPRIIWASTRPDGAHAPCGSRATVTPRPDARAATVWMFLWKPSRRSSEERSPTPVLTIGTPKEAANSRRSLNFLTPSSEDRFEWPLRLAIRRVYRSKAATSRARSTGDAVLGS